MYNEQSLNGRWRCFKKRQNNVTCQSWMLHVYPPSCELKSQKVKMYVTSLRYGFSGQELLSMFVLWSVREGIWGKGQLESKTKIFFPLRQYTGGWYFTIFAHLLSSILFVCFFFFTYDVYGTTNGARFQQGHDLRSSGVPDLLNNPYSTRIGWELIINGFRA